MEMVLSTKKVVLQCSEGNTVGGHSRKITTFQKIIRKFRQHARSRFWTGNDDWNTRTAYRIHVSNSEPPSYELLLILDGYKWPLPEPVELLIMREDTCIGSDFNCKFTGRGCCSSTTKHDADKLITLPCGHVFHAHCIHHLLRQYFYARCPTCQHTLHYRLCHHRIHIPYFTPGTSIRRDELDGACGTCAPFPFMQEQLTNHGPARKLPKSDRHFSSPDFGWHWWILSIFEGGKERYLAERSVLWNRLFLVCAGQDEDEREFALIIFDTLRLLYVHLKSYKGLDWVHALCLVGPIAYEEASLSNGKAPEKRGVDIWGCLMDMMVERLHRFHVRGTKLWRPYELLPFEPYYPMLEDLTDGVAGL